MKVKAISVILLIVGVLASFTGCQSETPVKTEVTKVICSQNEIKEPTELDVPQDGKLEIEMETLAKPDAAAPDEKAAFISVILKEDTNLSIQYTYDTYGKEGMMLCCEAADTETGEMKLRPIASSYLAQLSEEKYGETWLSSGLTLEKGENIFYVNGGEQTLPYRMMMTLTFQEPDNVEKIVMYPPSV